MTHRAPAIQSGGDGKAGNGEGSPDQLAFPIWLLENQEQAIRARNREQRAAQYEEDNLQIQKQVVVSAERSAVAAEMQGKITLWQAGIAFMGTAALLYTLFLTKKSLSATLAANKTTRDAFATDQRPWLSVSLRAADDLRMSDGKPILAVVITLTNHGKTPATDIRIAVDFIRHDEAAIAISQGSMETLLDGTLGKAQGFGLPLFPGQTAERVRQAAHLSKTHPQGAAISYDENAPGNIVRGFAVGVVAYRFALGGIGKTRFAYDLAKTTPSPMIVGGVGYGIVKTDEYVRRDEIVLYSASLGNTAE